MAVTRGTTIVVHGGAGRESPAERPARRAGVLRAVDAGWRVLAAGGAALDAAIAAVALLEDDPAFNAGLGSVLTEDGEVELDASVMSGETLAAGAVGAVRGVRNPVHLARALLDEGREVMLVGPPARALAEARGLAVCDPAALVTDEARRRWVAQRPATGETVGAVARDARGHVAAATSTGGVAGKRAGRVGDSALIGAGTYADDRLGAGSATGPGEAIIRTCLVRVALELVGQGLDPAFAAGRALEELRHRTAALAGLILVDPAGRIGAVWTTESMAAGWRSERSETAVVLGA
jgi:beta-aspartyl-peptidase (threonine type)